MVQGLGHMCWGQGWPSNTDLSNAKAGACSSTLGRVESRPEEPHKQAGPLHSGDENSRLPKPQVARKARQEPPLQISEVSQPPHAGLCADTQLLLTAKHPTGEATPTGPVQAPRPSALGGAN